MKENMFPPPRTFYSSYSNAKLYDVALFNFAVVALDPGVVVLIRHNIIFFKSVPVFIPGSVLDLLRMKEHVQNSHV
jgi:hypothetical protein